MLFIVTFHLLPESFMLGGLPIAIGGIVLGILLVITIEKGIGKMVDNPYMKAGLLLGISIAVHNLPEGLALGSSFLTDSNLGPVLALAMLLHNIPEGLSIAIPLRANRMGPSKVILYTILAGAPTGVGAFIGAYMGMFSTLLIALCLSFAGGTMLYIICDEIIPGAKSLDGGKTSSIGVVLGFVVGIVLYF